MRFFLLIVAVLASQNSLAQHSQYRGFAAVMKELSVRLAKPGQVIDLYEYVPAEGLETLLGTWYTFGSEHEFRNGSPNSVNVLIWYVTLNDLSAVFGNSCASPKLDFNPEFLGVLNKICDWPKDKAAVEDVMLAYWFSIMGYNAPESEYIQWRDFFLKSSYRTKTAKETVTAMTLAMTMNPYFLLNR